MRQAASAGTERWELDNLLALGLATAEHYRDCEGERSGAGRYLTDGDWGGLCTNEIEPAALELLVTFEEWVGKGTRFQDMDLVRARNWLAACNEASFWMDCGLLEGLIGRAFESRWA